MEAEHLRIKSENAKMLRKMGEQKEGPYHPNTLANRYASPVQERTSAAISRSVSASHYRRENTFLIDHLNSIMRRKPRQERTGE